MTSPEKTRVGTTMGQDCPPEYVRGWLLSIARQTGLVDYELAAIVERVTGHTGLVITEGGPRRADPDLAAAAVATMTPAQAKDVIDQAKARVAAAFPHGKCWTCGLALPANHQCEECV